MLDADETELLGCVYIDPPDEESPPGSDAVVSWWLVEQAIGTIWSRSRHLRTAVAGGDLGLSLAAFPPLSTAVRVS